MRRFNRCPRCKGNVLLDKDQHGWYEQCLQCGYIRDLKSIVDTEKQPIQGENELLEAGAK